MNVTQPIRTFSRRLYIGPVNVLLGLLIAFGLGTFWPGATSVFWDLYYRARPIATVEADILERTADAVTVSVVVTKHEDCDLISRYALAHMPDGSILRVRAERLDGLPLAFMEPGQKLRSQWKIYPMVGATRYEVYLRFSCNGLTQTVKAMEFAG